MDLHHETPSKSSIGRIRQMSCDSPFQFLPKVSTPPSRFTKILNPFEQHLVDRMHLPTFSPSVFNNVSTPKNNEKFKWTIDDISSLKPADIDEATISQHVFESDPKIESLVQERIDKFFNEKVIVPSPLNEQVKQIPLFTSPMSDSTKPECLDNYAQTVLTLPPKLPKHLEDALAPYFNYTDDQQMEQQQDGNSLLYRKLFEFEEQHSVGSKTSVESSPAPSTGLSPIQFTPEFDIKAKLESTSEIPELRDCALSPIGRSPMSRSACRLNFSAHMSVDASMVVPDVNKSLNVTNLESDSFQPTPDAQHESATNWDMEYKHVSILSRSADSSNSSTHSRIFTSQRKRLSDSFKEAEVDVEMKEENVSKRLRNRLYDDVTDAGYHTGSATISDGSFGNMFASTPTKVKF